MSEPIHDSLKNLTPEDRKQSAEELSKFNPGILPGLVHFFSISFDRDPLEVWEAMKHRFPEIADPSKCPNCGENMREYVYELNVLDASLLLAVAAQVRLRSAENDFTIANQVYIPSLNLSDSVRLRVSHSGRLGILAKVRDEKGAHVRGVWLITKRGWALLRGERVPSKVIVFRAKIQERFDDTTTMNEIFQKFGKRGSHHASMQSRVDDYREVENMYKPEDWVEFGDYHQGKMF